jgi:lysozyme
MQTINRAAPRSLIWAAFLLELLMMRDVNAAAYAVANSCEGTVYVAYRDPTGKLTAGKGHTGPDVKSGVTYTQAQVDAWLKADMAKAADFVDSRVTVPLTENQFSALAEFTFNVGVGNFLGSTLLRKLNRGDYAGAGEEILKWNKGRVEGKLVTLPGLTHRRALELKLYNTPDSDPAPLPPPLTQPESVKPHPPTGLEAFLGWLHDLIG